MAQNCRGIGIHVEFNNSNPFTIEFDSVPSSKIPVSGWDTLWSRINGGGVRIRGVWGLEH